jgi:hypothetical protein
MGACFNELVWEGTLTDTQLANQYQKYVDECQVEHGTDAYNGTFSTLPRIQIDKKEFGSHQLASEYVMNNTSKWEHALAVKFRDVRKENTREPTFDGKTWKEKTRYPVPLGGNTELDQPRDAYNCRVVMTDFKRDSLAKFVIVADQLTESQKAKLVKLYNEWAARHAAYMTVSAELVALCERIKQVRETVETADFARLKKLYAQQKKTWLALGKASVKLRDLDLKLSARLYKTEEVDHGLKWFIGGWCAE